MKDPKQAEISRKLRAYYDYSLETGDEFNLDFVTSLEDFFIERGYLSEKQEQALNNILHRLKIDY
jgi:hypothetical protein